MRWTLLWREKKCLLPPLVLSPFFHKINKGMSNTTWQHELYQSAITDVNELCRILSIPTCACPTDYPLFVPRPFVDLMERENPNDPLLLQVLPRSEENQTVPGFSKDPLNEIDDVKQNLALNKYEGRTLFFASNKCGIHCRFCFRRHFPQMSGKLGISQIQGDPTIEEVILSGGDPLMLDDNTLDELIQRIAQINHVRRIRIHSRLPIVFPSRLTQKLAEILTIPKPVYLVLHINHPNELSNDFLERREHLTNAVVMAQMVLLRGINDNTETLYRLYSKLVDARILPYYLHQLDKVEGAAHFEAAPEVGIKILTELRERLPGYALPAYVREVPGKNCKEVMMTAKSRKRNR